MRQCPNCGKPAEPTDMFCADCGTAIATQPNMSNVTIPIANGEVNIPTNAAGNIGAEYVGYTYVPETELQIGKKAKKKTGKKIAIIGSICTASVALVLVAVFVLQYFILGKEQKPSYALYVKNNELYYTGVETISPWKVTKELIDNGDENTEYFSSNLQFYSDLLNSYCTISDDGNILFYADKCSPASGTTVNYTLYYRFVNQPEKDAVKIDSDIYVYQLNETCTVVTYLKKGALYQHDLTNSEKIATDVDKFKVSPDGQKIVYVDKERTLYYKEKNKDTEKISDNAYLKYISDDFKTVYYTERDLDTNISILYKYTVGGSKETVFDNVGVAYVYGDDCIYYSGPTKKIEKPMSNYVIDDLKESDALITEPVSPAYPSSFDYTSGVDYNNAVAEYNEKYKKYQEDYEKYQAKLERDELREKIAKRTVELLSVRDFYYFDGQKETLLFDNFGIRSQFSQDTPIIAVTTAKETELKTVKLSEITSISDVREIAEQNTIGEYYVLYKTQKVKIAKTYRIDISEDGSCIYYGDVLDEKSNVGNLYRVDIIDGILQNPVTVAEDIDTSTAGFLNETNKYKWMKDVRQNSGDLYIDSEVVDYDVYRYDITYCEETDTTVYYTDRKAKEDGNYYRVPAKLKIFKDGQKQTVAEDVVEYHLTPAGDILYLVDYNEDRKTGDLYVFTDGQSVKIDDDVSFIMGFREGTLFGTTSYFTYAWVADKY